MGLDMYLTARRYLSMFNDEDEARADIIQTFFPELGIRSDSRADVGFRIENIEAEIAYWRKANQIHKWFVDNVQDGEDECRRHEVSWDQLCELRVVCQRVLKNHDMAAELLPSSDGFFFGNTEYDSRYIEDLEYTVEVIDKIEQQLVTETTETGSRFSWWTFYYQSSW